MPLIVLLLAAAPVSAPTPLPRASIVPYHDGMDVPPGAYVRTKNIKGLWAAGIALLSVGWTLTWSTTMVLCSAGCPNFAVGTSFVPLAGPIANAVFSVPLVQLFYATVAILQAAGIGMIAGGAGATKKYLVLSPTGVGGTF